MEGFRGGGPRGGWRVSGEEGLGEEGGFLGRRAYYSVNDKGYVHTLMHMCAPSCPTLYAIY